MWIFKNINNINIIHIFFIFYAQVLRTKYIKILYYSNVTLKINN